MSSENTNDFLNSLVEHTAEVGFIKLAKGFFEKIQGKIDDAKMKKFVDNMEYYQKVKFYNLMKNMAIRPEFWDLYAFSLKKTIERFEMEKPTDDALEILDEIGSLSKKDIDLLKFAFEKMIAFERFAYTGFENAYPWYILKRNEVKGFFKISEAWGKYTINLTGRGVMVSYFLKYEEVGFSFCDEQNFRKNLSNINSILNKYLSQNISYATLSIEISRMDSENIFRNLLSVFLNYSFKVFDISIFLVMLMEFSKYESSSVKLLNDQIKEYIGCLNVFKKEE